MIDVIANRPHHRQWLACWVRKSPIFDRRFHNGAFAVSAPHRNDTDRSFCQTRRHELGFCGGEVDAELTHGLDHLRMDAFRRPRPG